MQDSQGHINRKLQSQCIAQANEITHLRGCLANSVSLEEHMCVVDTLIATESRMSLIESRASYLESENDSLRRSNAEKDRRLADLAKRVEESERRCEAAERKCRDNDELSKLLRQQNCDARSVVELLTRCIFGRSSEKSEFTAQLADAVETAMDVHDADRFMSQLAGFCTSAMAMAGTGDVVTPTKPTKGTRQDARRESKPSKPREAGSGARTTSRNEGRKREHESRLRHGFKTIGNELDERFGISYGRYGDGVSYTIKHRKGAPDEWIIRIAYISKPVAYYKEYKVANIYSPQLGDDTSDRPQQIVEGCPFSPSFAGYYLTMKFAYNLSEKKIIRMLREIGCTVKQSTLNKWMHRVMRSVREAMVPVLMGEIQSSPFMHNDETRILVRVWNEDRQREEYRVCYIHGAYAPACRLLGMFYENGSREAKVIDEALFRDFRGIGFTADRCPIYDVVSTDESGKVILEYGACWTHGRRYCLQAYLSDSRFEGVMKCINVLFSIEKHCRVMEMSADQRLSFRQKHSAAVVDSIMDFLRLVKDSAEYGELAKRAANYMLNGEQAFRAFLRNGYIEFENNAIERLFRHLATGRRNWTHTGSHEAAKNIAFMYSLYESCVMNDVNFNTYIEEVLTRFMSGDTNYRDMLPNRITLSSKQQGAA